MYLLYSTSMSTSSSAAKWRCLRRSKPRYYQQQHDHVITEPAATTCTPVFSLLLPHLQTTRRHHCAMYEPHLVDLANQHSHGDHEGMSLLEELDKIAPIKSFDAFPKVPSFFSLSL